MTRGRILSVNAEVLPEWREVEGEGVPRQRKPTLHGPMTSLRATCYSMANGGMPTTPGRGFHWRRASRRILERDWETRLSLRIGAAELEAEVRSIRKVDWQSMRPNFFVVFPRQVLEQYPGMYMTSFRLLPDQKPVLNQLVSVLPTVTVIELDIVIREMRTVIDQVARALELVLGVILVAGALVLISGYGPVLMRDSKRALSCGHWGPARGWFWGPCG